MSVNTGPAVTSSRGLAGEAQPVHRVQLAGCVQAESRRGEGFGGGDLDPLSNDGIPAGREPGGQAGVAVGQGRLEVLGDGIHAVGGDEQSQSKAPVVVTGGVVVQAEDV